MRQNTSSLPSRPRRRKLRVLAGGVVLTALGIVGWCVYASVAAEKRLQEAVAEADGLDPGWRLEELEAARAAVPAGQNSALLVAALRKLLPPAFPDPGLDALLQDLPPAPRLNEQQVAALRQELAKAAPALGEARKLKDLPQGRFPITYSPDYVSTPLAGRQEARTAATLLSYDALLLAQEGRVDEALASCRGILNAGRSVGDEPVTISQLVRIACRSRALNWVERMLAQGEPSERSLADLRHLLDDEESQPLLLIVARGERAGEDHLMQAIQAGEVGLGGIEGITGDTWDALRVRLPGAVKNNRAALLRFTTEGVAIARLPIHQQRGPLQELQEKGRALPVLASLFAVPLDKTAYAWARSQAQLRSAIAAVTAERYRRARGHWPASLDVLAADGLLRQVPVDPYDGAPLRCGVLEDGLVIYSIGPDGKDDGGKLDRHATLGAGTDVGFRLWSVPQRRQPPLPSLPPPAAEAVPPNLGFPGGLPPG